MPQNALSTRYAIPGVGPLTATLAAADVGDGKGYESSRDYAASLGVAPRQHSCGDRQALIERRRFNKAAMALANKPVLSEAEGNARIIWARATGSGEYAAQVA